MTQSAPEMNEDGVIDSLRAKGYVILKNLVPEDAMNGIRDELDQWFAKTPRCQGDFYGWSTTRFGSLLTKAPSTQRLVLHSQIARIAEAVLGPHCDWYQLNLSQAVRIHPGAPQQPPHRDEDMWPGSKNCEYLINVLWAVDDFTAENGATRLWPRSQFSPVPRNMQDIQDMEEADTAVAEMPKGSAVVFLGSVTHCGGANLSGLHRTGIIFSYCLGWLKQYENQFLAYPPEVAADFSKELQDLIGYRVHRPNLGGYENFCPSILLRGNRPDILPAVDSLPPEALRQLEMLKTSAA